MESFGVKFALAWYLLFLIICIVLWVWYFILYFVLISHLFVLLLIFDMRINNFEETFMDIFLISSVLESHQFFLACIVWATLIIKHFLLMHILLWVVFIVIICGTAYIVYFQVTLVFAFHIFIEDSRFLSFVHDYYAAFILLHLLVLKRFIIVLLFPIIIWIYGWLFVLI